MSKAAGLRAGLSFLVLFALVNCGGVSDTTASASGHQPTPQDGLLSSLSARSVTVRPFEMERGVGVLPGRIGERTTIGNVTMGYVTLNPPPEVLFTNAIRSELRAAGHSVTGGPSQVSGVVRRFALSTPATAIYWDVTIDATLDVNVNGVKRSYSDRCVERTYVWPSDALISRVAKTCVSRITTGFRKDRSIANAL